MADRTRYAQVGIGGRSRMFTRAIVEDFSQIAELVALCDINVGRMELRNRKIQQDMNAQPVPMYKADDFDKMIRETRPDKVIVTTGPDSTHAKYICWAMELGCDVITEKPMTTDIESCKRILETQAETGRDVRVSFNYRYAPPRSQVKQLLMDGEIGEVLSVDFTWPLDTRHGADYFRRWHRKLGNSGSLLVHKATHHFDLVNWWLDDIPEEVFCHGTKTFYTPENADAMGLQGRSERCLTCPVSDKCNFYLPLEGSEHLKELYLENEAEDGYFRDRCVFASEIDIWDNMSVSVRYRRGAVMNYFLLAYSPWEGYQVAFSGTRGRLEHGSTQFGYISGEQESQVPGQVKKEGTYIRVMPHLADPRAIEPAQGEGGHGGGDPVLQRDLFDPQAPADPLGRKADQRDGAWSILTGVAAYHSIAEGRAVKISELIGDMLET